jgi:hypothetical protein
MLIAITMFGRRVTMGFSFEQALAYAREEEGRVRTGAYREPVAYQTMCRRAESSGSHVFAGSASLMPLVRAEPACGSNTARKPPGSALKLSPMQSKCRHR